MHTGHLAAAIEFDHGADLNQVRVGVLEFKANRYLRQELETRGVFLAQLTRRRQAVGQGGQPTRGFVLQALQELDAWHGCAVGVVGVGPNGDRAVGQVVAVGS